MQVAYVCGHPVVQTVLSCLYLHENLRHTTDPIVRSFCLGVLRTVDVLRQTIMSGDIYQEEDFSATLHGLGLCEFVDEAATNKILVAAEQHCTFKQRNAKKTSEATENGTKSTTKRPCEWCFKLRVRRCDLTLGRRGRW